MQLVPESTEVSVLNLKVRPARTKIGKKKNLRIMKYEGTREGDI